MRGARRFCPVVAAVLAVGVATVATATSTAAASIASPTWRVQASPNPLVPDDTGQLSAVSCVSKTFCMAVGSSFVLGGILRPGGGGTMEREGLVVRADP